MDAIEGLDWAAYSDFRFQISKYPALALVAEPAYYVSHPVALGVWFTLAGLLFFLRGRFRSSQIVAGTLLAALLICFCFQRLVPRKRPADASLWLGPDNLTGGFPAENVLLFMLAMILIGFAIWVFLPLLWHKVLFCVVAGGLTVWVILGQFYLGLHFLTDVLGAMAGATGIGWFVSGFLERDPGAN